MSSSTIKNIIIWTFITAIYFILRLGWSETIEFGYDQPRIALTVMKVIENKDFINVVKYIQLSNAAPDTITWGPFLIYFLTPFFLISKNPVIISQMLAVFNFLGIIATYLIGKKLFNQRVGILTAIFLTVFPWSVIFSRMIYNPTPLLTFIPLMMYLTIASCEQKHQYYLLFLPMLWSIVLQCHFLSICVVLVSFGYLLINYKKINVTYLLIGLVLGLILWFPFVKYELNNNFRFTRGFFQAPIKLQTQRPEWYQDSLTILRITLLVLSGQAFEYHLGYAYKDFMNNLPSWLLIWQQLLSIILIISFSYFIGLVVIKKQTKYGLILFWLLSLPLTIYLLKLPEIVPRYFLIILPAAGLILAVGIDGLISVMIKNKHLFKITLGIISFILFLGSSAFVIKYYHFLIKYDYPQEGWMGWLSKTSDSPYGFAYQSLNWIVSNAKAKGVVNLTISDDKNTKNKFLMNASQTYIWQYVFNKSLINPDISEQHYYAILGPVAENQLGKTLIRFGPFRIYQ